MNLVLREDVLKELGYEKLKFLGYTEDKHRWRKEYDIDLADLTKHAANKLRDLLLSVSHLPRVSARVKDVERWIAVLADPEAVRCRRIKDFAPMLKQFLKEAPKHWVYEIRADSEVYQPYYVAAVAYHPPVKRDGYTSRAFVTMDLYWEELGMFRKANETFYAEHCEDLNVARALSERGYSIESLDTLASYTANTQKYREIHNKIGLQFVAVGVAEEEKPRKDSWYSRVSKIRLDRDGVGSRVVVDLLNEDDKEKEDKSRPPSGSFWKTETCDHDGAETDDDNDLNDKIDSLVQIGHACVVGEDNIICAQTGLAGSSILQKNVLLAGQVGISGHLTIHDNAVVYAQSGVGGDVAPGAVISGSPAFDTRDWLRAVTAFPKLPDLLKTMRQLEKRVQMLEDALRKES